MYEVKLLQASYLVEGEYYPISLYCLLSCPSSLFLLFLLPFIIVVLFLVNPIFLAPSKQIYTQWKRNLSLFLFFLFFLYILILYLTVHCCFFKTVISWVDLIQCIYVWGPEKQSGEINQMRLNWIATHCICILPADSANRHCSLLTSLSPIRYLSIMSNGLVCSQSVFRLGAGPLFGAGGWGIGIKCCCFVFFSNKKRKQEKNINEICWLPIFMCFYGLTENYEMQRIRDYDELNMLHKSRSKKSPLHRLRGKLFIGWLILIDYNKLLLAAWPRVCEYNKNKYVENE